MNAAILAFTPFDPWHMLFFGLIALLLFGKRLPEVGRSLGKGIAEFKKGLHDVQRELNRDEPEQAAPKLQPPNYTPPRSLPAEPRAQAEPGIPVDVPRPGEVPAPQTPPADRQV